jgi:Tfp pilus assembly protein PilE
MNTLRLAGFTLIKLLISAMTAAVLSMSAIPVYAGCTVPAKISSGSCITVTATGFSPIFHPGRI